MATDIQMNAAFDPVLRGIPSQLHLAVRRQCFDQTVSLIGQGLAVDYDLFDRIVVRHDQSAVTPELLPFAHDGAALCFLRYALGRMTTITATCSEWLIKRWDSFAAPTQTAMLADIAHAIEQGKAGMEMDAEGWAKVLHHAKVPVPKCLVQISPDALEW